MKKHSCLLFLILLLFSGCASVNYNSFIEGDAENIGYVHFYIVENVTWAEITWVRHVVEEGRPIEDYMQQHAGYMGELDGRSPSLQIALPPGLHSFVIGGYIIDVSVEANMITPVNITTHSWNSYDYGSWIDVLPYVEQAIPYDQKWEPNVEEGKLKRESTDNPGFFIFDKTYKLVKNEIDMETFNAQMEILASAHSWTDEEMKILIGAVILTTERHIQQFVEFEFPYLAIQYTSALDILIEYRETLSGESIISE